ncbi:hypothetical protein [Deinococcus irradiatisoli]|uniref:hypothetical protein n=1 Tax=Deinococcus irradiatisoli TaxID=2202254 RepID=UPI0015E85892|nr:hypothetical protein [Deinococcus irradiatisoli]
MQVDAGQPWAAITRLHGIAVSTSQLWKAKYGGMTTDETVWFRLLEEENRHLKKLAADLSLDDQVLKEVVAKSGRPDGDAAIPDAIEAGNGGVCTAALRGHRTAGMSPVGLLALNTTAPQPWRGKRPGLESAAALSGSGTASFWLSAAPRSVKTRGTEGQPQTGSTGFTVLKAWLFVARRAGNWLRVIGCKTAGFCSQSALEHGFYVGPVGFRSAALAS